ncbi:MAG: COX15/CtaA family protein [Pseudomonadota bacterium]
MSRSKSIELWLFVCCAMVFAMVVLGGAVRLTGSGLSMVDWRPILGVLPPIGLNQWEIAFEAYKQFPEYQLLNKGMSLPEFKFIFYMEYAHRVLGRSLGLVFLVPLLIWTLMRRFDFPLAIRFWGIFLLGALQGLMGWYMVKSGLVDNPHVSQYRLTAHLMLAIAIYGCLVRMLVGFRTAESWRNHKSHKAPVIVAWLAMLVCFLMLATGGFVAGTRAGWIFNTYPKMGGDWIPNMLMAITPWWKNLFENAITIQFVHRWLAVVVLFVVLGLSIGLWLHRARPSSRWLAGALVGMVLLQVLIGIATLLLKVPLQFGMAHQTGGLLLWTLVVISWSVYRKSFRANL